MQIHRRHLIAGAAALAATAPALAAAKLKPFAPGAGPRSRLIYVNDLSGDIDGLFATVHALLSPTSQLRGIVPTSTFVRDETVEKAMALAKEMVAMTGQAGKVPIHAGAPAKLVKDGGPQRSAGVQAIIDEALRTDTTLPLYVAVGGGLTEVASAIMIEPKVAERITLVWIGGDAWPAGGTGETNFNIDPIAACFLYNETKVPIWQVSRAAYGTCLVSASELQAYVAPHGKVGAWLYRTVVDAPGRFKNYLNMGETWTLGDNPLVLLTSLTDWVPSGGRPFRYERTGSSQYDEVICPTLNADGTFTPRAEGRKIRIYRTVDSRLLLGDFFAKLAVNFPAK